MSRTSPLLLVIDDDPAIRELLSRELSLAGYETIAASDGVQGREMFERHRPDLVITDLAMPRADGMGRDRRGPERSTRRRSSSSRCAARKRTRYELSIAAPTIT